MELPSKAARAAALVACISVWSTSTGATTIDPWTWDQLVLMADFVGVVECTTSGGIYAEYSIVETLKGDRRPGESIVIRVQPNQYEPQYPLAFIGERYLVTGFAGDAPAMLCSWSCGPMMPLAWREIAADYKLPLFQGRWLLPQGREDDLARGLADRLIYGEPDEPCKDWEDFANVVNALVEADAETREAYLLRRLTLKYLMRRRSDPDEAGQTDLRESVLAAETAHDLLAIIQQQVEADPDLIHGAVRSILSQGGGPAVLKSLEEGKADWLGEKALADDIAEAIRRRMAPPAERSAVEGTPEDITEFLMEMSGFTKDDLDSMRAALAEGPEGLDFGIAFELLIELDPTAVADYLVTWESEGEDWDQADLGYGLGSYFAWKCKGDRKAHLTRLLSAADPYVRACAATYLCFEDEEAGVAALTTAAQMEGDPGTWAALNLLRRGHKGYADRALEVMDTPGEGNMRGVPHRNLQKRLMVLFSNSASAAGVPQPQRYDGTLGRAGSEEERLALQKELARHYRQWWAEHGDEVRLSDPWLTRLRKCKVD